LTLGQIKHELLNGRDLSGKAIACARSNMRNAASAKPSSRCRVSCRLSLF
jgi:hypothetical protein